MAQYTHLNETDIEEITGQYGLAVSSFESIVGGAENTSYLLSTDEGQIVLTFFENKTTEEAQRLGKLLRYLEEQSFPSTHVLALPDGELASQHQGKPVMLKQHLEGQVNRELNEDMLRQLGSTLARLHAVPAPDFLPHEPAFGLRRIRNGLAEVRDENFKEWLSERGTWVEQEMAKELPRGLIHADLFNDNMLFEGDRLIALIDFEDAGHYKLVYDIGMAVVGTCLLDAEIVWPKARALVEGYEAVRLLEEKERATLQASIEYGALSTAYWRYWKYNIRQPTPERVDKHLEMKAVAEQVAGIQKDELLSGLL